jgi:YhfZ C-terminal domain/Helix-turn-helix domain
LPSSRNGWTELDRRLAGYLVSLKEGDPLLSTRELAERFEASLGSISAAVNQLEETEAVKVSRRGHLGSFLEWKSTGALWSIAEDGPLVIALTLPSFPKCEGLATGLYTLLNGAGVATYLIFLRGSYNRIKALRNGQCNAVVMSALAAEVLCDEGEEVILTLPPRSFVEEHMLFFRQNSEKLDRPLTVGVDPESYDVKYLTELEFADYEVNLQPMTFTQIDLHLEDSSVDAAITNGDFRERLINKGFACRPLSPKVKALVGERYTSATLVIPAGSGPTKAVLQEILDPAQILEIQQKVVDGLMVPRY